MGNTDLHQFPNEGSKLKNPPSPKLVVSGSMSQSKTTSGSPKSPKLHDDSTKSDGASTSSSKAVRSPPSTKSSPGVNNKTLSLAERLAQSTRGKSNPALKSPVSKTPPINLSNTISTSKTDLSTELEKQPTDQCIKSEKIQGCNNSEEIQIENTQISNEKDLVIVGNGTTVPNEIIEDKQDICVESNNEIEVKEDLNEVVIIQGDDLTKPLRIDDNIIMELTSKKDIRQKVWEFLEENSLVVFPKPCFNRIPNFKGCINASQSLEKLEEFKKAKTVQVTPDKAQETARFITLNWGKRLLVPLLRLKEGLLQNVALPFAEPSIKMLRSASTQKGLRKWGHKLISSDQNNEGYHIDMVILGSVAVDRYGRRIGIGDGFCDLEFVILNSMNMISDKTIVVTIVHDAQVFNTLPSDIFKPYDVPVDIIITSTEIIRVETRLDRPKDVFWNYISKRRLLEMPPLQLLHTRQEKDNDLDCTLKDVDSEPEEIPPSPKTFKAYKKLKGYRQRRSYSNRSETNDSVFKEPDVSKSSTSKQPSVSASRKSDSKIKPNKRAKSTSNQQNRNDSTSRPNSQQNDQKEQRSSKKANKRRTKSESAKTVTSPASDSKNSDTQADSPSLDNPKNKRRSQQKQRQQPAGFSDDNDKTIRPTIIKVSGYNKNKSQQSRSSSRATRRDYIDHQDDGREISAGRKASREYIQSPRKYYSQNRYNSYSQDRPLSRSNSQEYHRDSSRSASMHQNRYSNGPAPRQSRYYNGSTSRQNSFNGSTMRQNNFNGSTLRQNNFNGSTLRHNSFNGGSMSRHNGGNIHPNVIRHNSFSNNSLSQQNGYYDEDVNNRRNSFSKGSIRQEGYTNSRVFRPPRYVNGIAPQTVVDRRDDYVRESRPRFNSTRSGYYDSNEKPNYSRSFSGDEFVLKVGNIANNVRVRDLKAALMERGVKPLHITWRGPRGFAYLRYNNSNDVNKDNVMDSLHNVRIKPNGVETSQTQTLIVTECQLS